VITPVVIDRRMPGTYDPKYWAQRLQFSIGGKSELLKVLVAEVPSKSDAGFFARKTIDYRIRAATTDERRIAIECGFFASHVLVKRFDGATRLLIPVPLNLKNRQLLRVLSLYSEDATEFRLEQAMSRLYRQLLPWRIREMTFARAFRDLPRSH
jgi:hypothetical protein